MALNLGDINFGLGVDTRRLSSSMNDIVKFGRAVDSASARSSEASKKAAADLRKQEKAALSALQQTLRFNEQVRKAGAPTRLLTDSARAFSEYTASITKGQVATLDFQRSQSKFQADMARSTRSLNRFKAQSDTTSQSVLGLSGNMSNLASAATLAVGPLSGIGARITALTSIANRSNLAMVGLIAGITGAGVVIGKFSTGAIQTAIQLDKVRARLLAVTGSTTEAAAEFEKIRTLSDATGTELISVANGYAKIAAASQGTALEGKAAAQVFEDVLFGAAQFRTGTQELNGVLKAFEQIMSKGIVQSEELRGQLGDRLVGAFNIAAQSMGVTTEELNKMLKSGKVMSDEFLPKFAAAFRKAVGADQVRRVTGLQASMNRFANSQTAFNAAFDETFGISKLFENAVQSLTGAVNFFADNMKVLGLAAASATGALLVLAGPRILSGLVLMGRAIKTATVFMFGFNTAIMANPLGGFLTIITRVGAALAGAAAGFGLASSAMANADTQQQRLIDTVDQYIEAQQRQRQSAAETTSVLRKQVEDQIQSLQNGLLQAQRDFDKFRGPDFSKFNDPVQLNLALRFSSRDAEAFLDARKQLNTTTADLNAQLAELRKRWGELSDIEKAQVAAAEARLAAEKAIISVAEQGAIKQIARLNAEVMATADGVAAVQALKAEFQQADVIDKFTANLVKAGVEAAVVANRTEEFAQALDALKSTQQTKVLEDTSTQIKRIRQEIEAMDQGSAAVEALKQSFANADAVSAFHDRLVAAGVEMELVRQQTEAFRRAMIDLDEATKAQNATNAIAEITAEIDRMRRKAVALQEGEAAVRALNQEFANSQAIETFRARLEDAGVESSILEGLIRSLTGALFTLQSVAGQVRIDAAIDSAAEATDKLRRETEALAGGEDAFTAFRNAERVTANLAQLEKTLRNAGAGEDAIATQLAEREAALNANITAQTTYDELLRNSRRGGGGGGGGSRNRTSELESLQQKFEKLEALQEVIATGAESFNDLQRNLAVADRVEEYRQSLEEANISQAEINRRVEIFRKRAIAFEETRLDVEHMTNALEEASGMLQGLVDRAAQLEGIDFGDIAGLGLQAAEEIATYRRALEDLGLNQDQVNQRIDEYRTRLQSISQEEAALQQIADIFENVQSTIMDGWDSVADSMADALVSGKFDLSTLADIGAQVASELLANFLKLAVIRPLLNSIFGGFGGIGGGASFGQLFSGAGGNFFGTLFSRKGNAFSGDGPMDVSFARKGAILTGPTAFGTGDGGLTIGGEAGDEGILPLARDSSGDLGVMLAGGSGGNTINFNFPPGTDATSFQKSESQMSAVASRVAARGSRNQ